MDPFPWGTLLTIVVLAVLAAAIMHAVVAALEAHFESNPGDAP